MLVEIKDTLVSIDLFKEYFCCDLGKCHGACCVEGDAGAPVDLDEIEGLEEAAEVLRDELTEEAREVIDEQGVVYIDKDGTFVTSIVNDRDCVFAVEDEIEINGTRHRVTLCAIDRAKRAGRIDVDKPISCALYPVRLSTVGDATAVNYHQWNICSEACKLGKTLELPLYKYLKDPLIRAFGQEWYDECCLVAEELQKAGYFVH